MIEIEADVAVDDLSTSEAELERKERWLAIEVDRVSGLRKETSHRIGKARGSAEDALLKAALGELSVPTVIVREKLDEARLARIKALAVRKGCFERVRDALRGCEAELDRLNKRVREEEQAAKVRAVQKPMTPPPPPPETDDEVFGSLSSALAKALEAKPVAPDERRIAQRKRLCAEISMASDSNLFTGFTNDVSEGGVFVATVELLPLGAKVDLSFDLPGGQHVEGRGEVRWVRENNDATPDIFPGMGIRFLDVPAASVAAIKAFAAQREPMFFPD